MTVRMKNVDASSGLAYASVTRNGSDRVSFSAESTVNDRRKGKVHLTSLDTFSKTVLKSISEASVACTSLATPTNFFLKSAFDDVYNILFFVFAESGALVGRPQNETAKGEKKKLILRANDDDDDNNCDDGSRKTQTHSSKGELPERKRAQKNRHFLATHHKTKRILFLFPPSSNENSKSYTAYLQSSEGNWPVNS